MITLCFRFDDPSPTSDHELEAEVLDLARRFDVPLCVATIPFSQGPGGERTALSEQNAGHLLEAARKAAIEIAQHGHSHVSRGTTDRGARSEFAGVALAEQRRLIQEGLAHLSGLLGQRIRGFVPPWNSYDRSTAQAVAEAGFDFLSAGEEVIRYAALPVIPRTCTLNGLRGVVERALHVQALAPVLVVAFHPDDFAEFRSPPLPEEPPPCTSLRDFSALLEWVRGIRVARIEALSDVAASVRHGAPLVSSGDLKLPYRVKALLPPMLTRSAGWRSLPRAVWGAFRGARSDSRPLAADAASRRVA